MKYARLFLLFSLLFCVQSEQQSVISASPAQIIEAHHCIEGDYGGRVHCNKSNDHEVVSIQRGYWIGDYNNQTVVGLCKFCQSFHSDKTGRFVRINSTDQCLKNRNQSSILCYDCDDDYAIAINSDNYLCEECSKGEQSRFFLLNVSTLFALLLFIFIFDFSPASGALNSLVFFAQITTTTLTLDIEGFIPMSSVSKYEPRLSYLYQSVNAFWKLDFTYPENNFCFKRNMEMVQILALKYVVALMTLVPVVFLILFAKFFDKIQNGVGKLLLKCFPESVSSAVAYCTCFQSCLRLKRMIRFEKDTSIQTLVASCFLLSYIKFTMVTFYLLAPVSLYNARGDIVGHVLYLEGGLPYPGNMNHWRYAWLAVIVLCTIVIGFPILLLLLRYHDERFTSHRSQCCTRSTSSCNCKCVRSTLYYLNKFLDKCILLPFQKDLRCGRFDSPCSKFKFWKFSFGLHDYRWYAGWYFLLRSGLFAVSIFNMDYITQLIIQQVLIAVALGISVALHPYKRRAHNRIDGFVFLLILVINFAVFYQYYRTVSHYSLSFTVYVLQYILSFIPAMLIVIYFIVKLYRNYHRDTTSSTDDYFVGNRQTRASFMERFLCNCQLLIPAPGGGNTHIQSVRDDPAAERAPLLQPCD